MFKPNKRKIEQVRKLFDSWAMAQMLAWPDMWKYEFHNDSTGEGQYKDDHGICGVLREIDGSNMQYIAYSYIDDKWKINLEYNIEFRCSGDGIYAGKGIGLQQFEFIKKYQDYMLYGITTNYLVHKQRMDDANLLSIYNGGCQMMAEFKGYKAFKAFYDDFINLKINKYEEKLNVPVA